MTITFGNTLHSTNCHCNQHNDIYSEENISISWGQVRAKKEFQESQHWGTISFVCSTLPLPQGRVCLSLERLEVTSTHTEIKKYP